LVPAVTDSRSCAFQDFVDSSNVKIETMKRKKRARRDDGEGGDAGETQRMTAS